MAGFELHHHTAPRHPSESKTEPLLFSLFLRWFYIKCKAALNLRIGRNFLALRTPHSKFAIQPFSHFSIWLFNLYPLQYRVIWSGST